MKVSRFTVQPRFILILVCGLLLMACAARPIADIGARTSQGLALGIAEDGSVSFLGIEYARARRWALPEAGPAWAGKRTFSAMGSACPQDGQETMVEDCLFLNVFAPGNAARGSDLPVLVWIHGGGLRAGFGGDGPKVFTRDGIVVVSFNYRLGLLGFRDWPGWSEADPRNFGQADMVRALQWVQANIRNFGGNPDNVTIYGHSAGGTGVQLMMVDRRARGLFQRAISDAGLGAWPFPRAANPPPDRRARLRYPELDYGMAPEALVAQIPYYHLPIVGGSDLPRQPVDVFKSGDQAPVPYMSGANSFDGYGTLTGAGFTTGSFLADYRRNPLVRSAYAADFAASDAQAAARLFGDLRYVFTAWSTVRAMQAVKMPGYLFYYDQVMGDLPGTPHGGHYGQIFAGDGSALKTYIVSFIKSGRPDAPGLPKWNGYDEQTPTWMVFDPQARPVPGALTPRMRVLEALKFPQPGAVGNR